MKKLFYLLLFALPFGLWSCNDDNDLPDVDFNFTISGATKVDGVLYVVQGDALTFESITVTNREQGKNAMITAATFYWDYYLLGTTVQPPFAYEIETDENTPVGRHLLEIACPVFAEGKILANAVILYDVKVVASADDIPENGVTSFKDTPTMSTDSKAD